MSVSLLANITFDQLPASSGLSGDEIVPIDTPIGGGNYVTGRTTAAQIANLASPAGVAPVVLAQANPLFSQARVLAATVGDITLADAGPQSTLTIDLAATTVTPGTYGSTSAIAQFTVDQKGRLQAAGNIDISGTYQPLSANLTSWAAITRAAGFDTWVGAPSSANLRALMTDETGTGALYFQGGDLGTPSAGVLTNATGLPIGTGISGLAANMAAFLAGGTSAQLAATVTDETGFGALVFANSPTLSSASLGASSTATTQTLGDNSTKIATTAFVQAAVNATTTLPATRYATTAALPSVTYANGSSGVGATLTATTNGALSIDSTAVSVNDVVLVKNQASTFQNGIYTVTATGSAGAPFVLTRATYYNIAADINLGDNTFVSAGATLAGTTWQQNGTEQPVIGTNPITFAQVAGVGTYTAGNGLTLTGTQFALSSPVSILNGGTGQTTASAAFDALSPTTTRGDISFRNATTNARLAASTAGYLLQTNGAGADPAWVGFLQSGTSAVTRTWTNKVQESVSVKDFGAVGDGVTNDTSAIQAAETYRASIGGELVFQPGNYLVSGIVVNRANGGGWKGIGNVRLLPNAASVILCDVAGAVVSPTTSKVWYVEGIEFNANAQTSVTGYREASPYLSHISKCKFNGLQFSCILNGSATSAQTGWVTISDIDQIGQGSWLFRSADDSHYIFNIIVDNFNQQGTGASPWTGTVALFQLNRATSIYFNNINAGSLDGAAKGFYIVGDSQGVFLNNVIVGWPTYGVHSVVGTDTLIPSYVYINNCGMDQPTVAGYDIAGRTWLMTNFNATNGYLRSSTGPGVHIQATATDINISGALCAYMNNDGFTVETGAAKVRVNGLTAENNNQIAGAYYDINLNACSFTDVKLYGKNVVGTAGVNATGQRLINGITSQAVSLNNTPASTGANTTATDLMTYSIPANALKIGQRVRVKAWGTTAANANTKTGRLFFGTTNTGGWSGTLNANGWEINCEVDITGSNAQSYNRNTLGINTITQNLSGTATEVMTSAIIAKFQGQNGTASAGDITCNGLEVEILD